MMAAPLSAGANQVSPTVPSVFAVWLTITGASGTDAAVTLFDAEEGLLFPMLLVAVTVKVYEVPWVSPAITVLGDVGFPLTERPAQLEHAGLGVTVYPVIVEPLSEGAVQVRVTEPSGSLPA